MGARLDHAHTHTHSHPCAGQTTKMVAKNARQEHAAPDAIRTMPQHPARALGEKERLK